MNNLTQRFLLEPEATARAQEIFYRLSRSAVACAMFELVELARERTVWDQAQGALFERDYVSKRQIEFEHRAQELEAEGRRCWALQMKHRARKHWEQADSVWEQVDRILEDEKINLNHA